MSVRIDYNPDQFHIERATTLSASLGTMRLGETTLGASSSGWAAVEFSSFSMNSGYSVNDDRVLIVEAESATLSISRWGPPWEPPVFPADLVRARYGNTVLFVGRVDQASHTTSVDPDAQAFGHNRRTDFTVTLVGQYAAALGRKVCWTYLPEEPSIDRIRRWVTVNGWTGGDGTSPSEGS